MKLPVIVGMGGINSAGRTSGFHSFKRMIYSAISEKSMSNTWMDFSHRMKLMEMDGASRLDAILKGTLIRRIDLFDPNHILSHQSASFNQETHFAADLFAGPQGDMTFHAGDIVLRQKYTAMTAQSAGCLPRGFNPGDLYHSKNHPRGLTMSIYGMSDAITSLGMDWDEIMSHIYPDQLAVYAGSALAQIDDNSIAGLVANPLKGGRISSKMMPLSLAEMPADFVNSYVLNSVGSTGHNMGACATFLYNLRMAVHDIQSGKARIAIAGSAEAPVTPDVMEGFNVMGALATDESLKKLDHSETTNYRRACRPFSTNTGFVMAESSQFAVLMADDLAIELGLEILGSVPDVFVNADGNKKSIASPGIGNYITMAKTAALAEAIIGKKSLEQTYVHAHGTGTPQNRVTESHILNEIAKTFSVSAWKVAAIKSYVGHSMGVAAGDQLAASLGSWKFGVLPGIETIDHIADDVYHDHLDILRQHYIFEKSNEFKATLINSKGFGGNNATALVLSPQQTLEMLKVKHGSKSIKQYHEKNEKVNENQHQNDEIKCSGQEKVIYHFGNHVLDMEDVRISPTEIHLKNYAKAIQLPTDNPYESYVTAVQEK
jgi:acetoacetyl-[acyl-carrier protein] synthase